MRIGKFSITAPRYGHDFGPAVKRIMGMCVIIRAEMDYQYNRFEYVAICDLFDEVSHTQSAPHYMWICHKLGAVYPVHEDHLARLNKVTTENGKLVLTKWVA